MVNVGNVQVLDPVALPYQGIHALPPISLNATLGQAGLWSGEGPPGTIVGSSVGDEYLNTLNGDIYTLFPG